MVGGSSSLYHIRCVFCLFFRFAHLEEIYWISSEGKVLDVGFLGEDSFVEDDTEYDIASINEAMQNYYKSMGWID